jgi:arylsulfatase
LSLSVRHVVFVSYDSVRVDVALSLGLPGLERLRQAGSTFSGCISSAPLTPVSHASVMTGLQPYRHGIRRLFKEQLRPTCTTMASCMARAGFRTGAVVSCAGLNRWYGIDRGFEHYDDEIPKLADGRDPLDTVDVKLRGLALKRAELVRQRAAAWLEPMSGERVFFFMHFFDAHWPYAPPDRPFSVRVANEYEAEVAYLDHHFGLWLDWFSEHYELDETLFVLFADHGEDLGGWYEGDRGGEEHGHPEEMGHGCLLHDQTIRVPLLVSHPALPRQEITHQVRLVDVMPTALDLAGLDIPPELDGVSLRDVIEGRRDPFHLPAYSETHYPREQVEATGGQFGWTHDKKAVRLENRFKTIFHLDSDLVEGYDLARDPLEKQNLYRPGSG